MEDLDSAPYSPIDFGVLAAGALGFTVALAWNDAVSVAVRGAGAAPVANFGAASPVAGVGVGAAALHAAVVTALVVVIAFVINSIARAAHSRHARHAAEHAAEHDAELKRDAERERVAELGRDAARGAERRPRSIVRLWSPTGTQ